MRNVWVKMTGYAAFFLELTSNSRDDALLWERDWMSGCVGRLAMCSLCGDVVIWIARRTSAERLSHFISSHLVLVFVSETVQVRVNVDNTLVNAKQSRTNSHVAAHRRRLTHGRLLHLLDLWLVQGPQNAEATGVRLPDDLRTPKNPRNIELPDISESSTMMVKPSLFGQPQTPAAQTLALVSEQSTAHTLQIV